MNATPLFWEHPLREIWPGLQQLDPHIQLLGGYGLYLKQSWLADNLSHVRALVPLPSWTNTERHPRTTKDMDVGVSLDLITSSGCQQKLAQLLQAKGYTPHDNKRKWGWTRDGGIREAVELEFSTLPPAAPQENLSVDRIRVKRKPGLPDGVHAHINRELIGFEHSFSFEYHGLSLTLPNVITAAMMKLKAFQDQRDLSYTSPSRETNLAQAEKHARDIFRIVAMETEEEAACIPGIQVSLRDTSLFRECGDILQSSFLEAGQPGLELVASHWNEAPRASILAELQRWFLL